MSILDWSIKDTGFAVVSIKTTGLTHGYDKICEIAVVQAAPGQPLRLALDTLVDPGRPLAGAEIHGIRDHHVKNLAPTFDQVALDLVRQLQQRVLVGHNLNFTLRFLEAELTPLGVPFDIPYIDTMNLTSMLTKTPNRPLLEACDAVGIEGNLDPTAAAAALDTGKLLRLLSKKLGDLNLNTFRQIQGKKRYPFQQSLDHYPLPIDKQYGLEESVSRQSRYERGIEGVPNVALALYWDALLVALDDMVITDEEMEHLHRLQAELELSVSDVYMLHARVYAGSLVAMVDSRRCTVEQRRHLALLRQCLVRLGWAPGDMPGEDETDASVDESDETEP